MKKRILSSLTLVLMILTAMAFTRTKGEEKIIDRSNSKVVWKGYKVTGAHQGTVAFKQGKLVFDQNRLIGGEFEIDMTTITATDLSGENKDKLNRHLKSDDFFGVAMYPTATLKISNVEATGKNSYRVTGNLTIKGKTNPVLFTMSVYGNKANATLKIDRSAYDVRYGSGSFFDNLGDKTIYDEFDLIVDLQF